MLSRLKRWLSSGNTPLVAQKDAGAHAVPQGAPLTRYTGNLPLDAALAVANGRITEDKAREAVARGLYEQRRRVREAGDNPASLWATALVDPFSWADDTPDFYPGIAGGMGGWGVPWMLNNQGRGDYLPVYINEYGLKLIRDWSRKILAFNEFAINAVENRVSYIVGKGFQYSVLPKRRSITTSQAVGGESGDEPKGLAAKAQAVLDEFVDRERWNEREQECVRRCDRDGEAILRFFRLDGGRTAVRFVEPECLTDQSGVPNHSYGVVTDPEDIENVEAYSIVGNPAQGWTAEDVPAAEVLHIKANSDFNAKRGLPTLFAVRKNLERADKLLRNMSVMAQVQATFAVIRKHKQFGPSAVSAYQKGQGDVQSQMPISGRSLQAQQLLPGSIIDASDKTDYQLPNNAGASGQAMVAILQAELRAVCARLVMPEWMLTVDASNGNFASSLVAEAPAVKNFERLQAWFARRFGDGEYGALTEPEWIGVMWRVLANAVEGGLLPRETLTDLEIQVEGPTLVVRNKSEETSRAKTLSDAGILSDATWAKWEGLDYDQERRQGAAPKQQGPAPFGADGPGGGTPESAPPGSAEGETVEEAWLREEAFTGTIKDKLGREIHYVNGRRVKGGQEPTSGKGQQKSDKPQGKREKPAAGKAAGATEPHPGAAHGSKVKVTVVKEMAAPRNDKGKIDPIPVEVRLTKQETGRVAEAAIRAYLRDIVGITDTVALNSGKTNESIDLFGDSMAPEVKGGLCSNGKGAQQWRITFSMELSKGEQSEYEAMTAEQQKAWREKRQRACLERKIALLEEINEKHGKEIKAVTYTGIVNPDKRTLDIYRTEGYHQRVSWSDPRAKYQATVRYDHADD